MFVVDTCSIVAYFENNVGRDTKLIDDTLFNDVIFLSPIVLAEVLSAAQQPSELIDFINGLKRLDFRDGFWERSGELRKMLRARKLKANLADALIAQSCIDHDATLITRDRDFRHYVDLVGLKVA